jgi:hypothetical protein
MRGSSSALIQRTKKIQIAILGRARPLVNNPTYIAEEFAMLDNLSKGRFIAGFVRGIGSEYHSSGVKPYFSHGRFHEAHDLIIRAWTEPGPFAFDGSHFSLRYVNLWPMGASPASPSTTRRMASLSCGSKLGFSPRCTAERDSPLETKGFESSVPREGSYAHETAPFDRYGGSLQSQGADSFARGTDGSNPYTLQAAIDRSAS